MEYTKFKDLSIDEQLKLVSARLGGKRVSAYMPTLGWVECTQDKPLICLYFDFDLCYRVEGER